MASEVQPILHEIFEIADNTGKLVFDRPIVLQVTKFKPTPNGYALRVSDGQYTMASMLQPDLDTNFAEVGRIVKLFHFEAGCTDPKEPGNDSTRRVYINIYQWSDLGPGTSIVGTPSPMNISHIQGAGMLKKKDTVQQEVRPTANIDQSSAQNISSHENGSTTKQKKSKEISIEALSPFISNWRLLARVSRKSDVREFVSKTTNNNGKVFNLILSDETGDISVTGFTEAADKFYNMIVEGQQYYFSGFSVRDANKRFNQTSHGYELIFQNDSDIQHANDTDKQLPSVFFKFVDSIADLANHKVDSNVDVVGIASKIGDAQTITSKSSSIPYNKRDIELLDDSGTTISLTLWGNDAEGFSYPVGTVIGVKGARLSSFNGMSLSATRSAVIYADPDDKRAHKLKGWYQATGGSDIKQTPISTSVNADSNGSQSQGSGRTTIAQAVKDCLGRSDKPDFFKLKARIASIMQKTIAYPSCTQGDCKKKLIQESDGQWRCEKCQVTQPAPQWRYILNMILADPSSEETGIQVSAFDEVGRKLYGDRAQEFVEVQQNGSSGEFNRELADLLRVIQGKEYIWTIKATLDHYNGDERVRNTLISVQSPDIFAEGEQMMAEIGF